MLNHKRNEFVIIGHPKASTDVSIRNLERFVDERLGSGDHFCTFEDVVQ